MDAYLTIFIHQYYSVLITDASALLVKSADTLGNVSELIDDFEREGDTAFANFNAPKEKIIENYLNIASTILTQWAENPLRPDLQNIAISLERISSTKSEKLVRR